MIGTKLFHKPHRSSAGLILAARWTRCILAATATLALVVASPELATACSPPPPTVQRDVQPVDGASKAVLNTQVRVTYTQWSGPDHISKLPAPLLVDDAGKQVPAKATKLVNNHNTIWLLQPDEPLKKATKYVVRDFLGVEDKKSCWLFGGGGDKCEIKEVTAATFTTGDSADVTKPTVTTPAGPLKSSWSECDNSACCGPYKGYYVQINKPVATDDAADDELRFNVYFNNETSPLAHFAKLITGATQSGFLTAGKALGLMKDGSYKVCVVDLAGNETCPNQGLPFTTPPAPGVDAGGSGGTDAGGTDAGSTDAGTDTDTVSETDTDTVSETDSDTVSETDTAAVSETDTAAETDSVPETDTVADPDAVAADAVTDAGSSTAKPKTDDSGCSARRTTNDGPLQAFLVVLMVVGLGWRRSVPAGC